MNDNWFGEKKSNIDWAFVDSKPMTNYVFPPLEVALIYWLIIFKTFLNEPFYEIHTDRIYSRLIENRYVIVFHLYLHKSAKVF